MTIVDDFLQKFYSLEGVTITERQKNFYILLHHSASFLKGNSEALDGISSNLTPRTYLESLFRVDFLTYFRRKNELFEILKEGYSPFVGKIIKHDWFFKEAFDDVSAENLVDELLPYLSFSVRMKVLKKLSRYLSCEKFENIFDGVVHRYGIFIGSQFITGCGPDKIRQILNEYPIKLTTTQLRILFGKDRQLVKFYFECSKHSVTAYKSFLRFLFNNDRVLFNKLRKKYDFKYKMGRRATKEYVPSKKDDIIKRPYYFSDFLDMRAVIRKIGKDSVELFINILPEEPERCINRDRVFQSFPRRYHYSLYFRTFQHHYNIKFDNHLYLIDEELLRLTPEPRERAMLAQAKVNEGFDKYIKYLLVKDSISLIKEKINLTSDIYERGRLIKLLIETCHINNDLDALLSVMKYFCFRHKNDELSVHLQFIQNIENLFGYSRFTEEMWSTLNELLTIHMLKFDKTASTLQKVQTLPLVSFNIGTSDYQKLSYIQFLFKMGKPVDELITDYFTNARKFPKYVTYDKDFGKYFLVFVIKNMSKESYEPEDLQFNCSLITQIENFKKCYSDDQISFYDFPTLLHSFNYITKNFGSKIKPDYYHHIFQIFSEHVFTTTENIHKKDFTEVLWNNFHEIANINNIQWLLNYDPLNIVSHFDSVFQKMLSSIYSDLFITIWFMIKKFGHLQLDEMCIQAGLTKLTDETENDVKLDIIYFLSILMKPGDYAALADSYKPADKKLDLKNIDEVRLYNLQCAIAKNFKNTKSYEVLPSLLNYCAGDYFKCAMKSLYSLLYHTPENLLPQHLNYLSKQAVSVRKHALYFTCELCTYTKVENLIRIMNKQEKDQSLKKHMFDSTIQYFVKNPSDQIFELVKLNMVFISNLDEESLQSIITHLSNVPEKYKCQYVQYSWKYLETTVTVWNKLAPLKISLLWHMNSTIIEEMPLDFALKIIDDHFKTEKNLNETERFMFNLLCHREEKGVIFEKIFAILDRSQQHEIFNLFEDWYSNIMDHSTNLPFFEPFVNYYTNLVSLTEHFHYFIKLFFLRLKLRTPKHFPIDEFTMKVITFFEELIAKCGEHITHLFATDLDCNLKYFTSDEITINDLYYSMVKQRRLSINAILVLHVATVPFEYSDSIIFNKLLKEIMTIDDVGVQINLRCKFQEYLKTPRFLKSVSEDMKVEGCS